MPKELVYPTKETIIFTNEIINIMSNRKADQHKLLRQESFIEKIIDSVKNTDGDV